MTKVNIINFLARTPLAFYFMFPVLIATGTSLWAPLFTIQVLLLVVQIIATIIVRRR